jgi:hypothetical protein
LRTPWCKTCDNHNQVGNSSMHLSFKLVNAVCIGHAIHIHIVLLLGHAKIFCESIICGDISPSSQPDQALSALNYGLTPNCNVSQSRHGHTPIACAHTTGSSNNYLSQVPHRNLLISQYKQGCNQCEHSYTQVYQHLNANQLHINAPYKHLSGSVSTSPVERTT